jgi:uncharacterized membrane protein YphA (DoxX/SURF4 family)
LSRVSPAGAHTLARFAEFFLGVFIFGGLFTRPLALVGAVVAAFQALTLGLAGGVVAPCWRSARW